MHHRRFLARILHDRRATHHAFFRADAMGADQPRGLHIVLFPPWAGAVVFFLYVVPLALLG